MHVAFGIYAEDGTPVTGATPTFVAYADIDGNARSQPTIVEVGNGVYLFEPSEDDVEVGTAYLVETTEQPTHYAGSVGNLVAWVVFTEGGTLHGGATSVFLLFKDFTGADQAQPTIENIGGTGLYAFEPSAGDLDVGRVYEIDNGSNTVPTNIFGTVEFDGEMSGIEPPSLGAGIVGPPLDGTAGAGVDIGRDLEIDIATREFMLRNGDLNLTVGIASIYQDIDMRLRFWRGEWFLDGELGVPYLERILTKPPRLADVRTVMRDQLLDVVGVKDITDLRFQFDGRNRTLSIFWTVSTDLGELSGVAEAGA